MKCKDCGYREEDWIAAYDGRGLIQISVCKQDPCAMKLVDPDVSRDCEVHSKPVKELIEALEGSNAT